MTSHTYFSFVVSVIMIYETFGFLGVSQNSLVGPPLSHVPITVVVSSAVVESVSQFVTKNRADGAVIQRSEIEKSIYREICYLHDPIDRNSYSRPSS